MHPAHERARVLTADDDPTLLAWALGRSGYPFADACMRSLVATGWLNFRMRAMLTSFAVHHLGLDWRACGLHLARSFTDYEPGIHWPQVQMQGGQTGINTPRIYNPVKQGLDQDPTGVFTRRWVPELAEIPMALLQTPWLAGTGQHTPIIDPGHAIRDARARLSQVRADQATAPHRKRCSASTAVARAGWMMITRCANGRSEWRKRRRRSGNLSWSFEPLYGEICMPVWSNRITVRDGVRASSTAISQAAVARASARIRRRSWLPH